MKNKKDLMTKLAVVGGGIGYFCMARFPIGIRISFIVIALFAIVIYTVESIKNKYNRISTIFSILLLVTFIILFVDEMIINKYPQFLGYRSYTMVIGAIIIIIMLVYSAINYIKLANRKEIVFTKILLLFMLVGIILLAILVVLKKIGIIT